MQETFMPVGLRPGADGGGAYSTSASSPQADKEGLPAPTQTAPPQEFYPHCRFLGLELWRSGRRDIPVKTAGYATDKLLRVFSVNGTDWHTESRSSFGVLLTAGETT